MEKAVALLEKGVLGVHEGQHLRRETTARSQQALGQSKKSLSLSTYKHVSLRSNPFPSQSN